MGSSKSLKTPAFLKKSDLLLFFSSLLIGLKWREFSNFWMIPFTVRIGSLYNARFELDFAIFMTPKCWKCESVIFEKIRFVIISFKFADWLNKAGIFKLLEDPIPS